MPSLYPVRWWGHAGVSEGVRCSAWCDKSFEVCVCAGLFLVLNLMRASTGSQWRQRRNAVMWENLIRKLESKSRSCRG